MIKALPEQLTSSKHSLLELSGVWATNSCPELRSRKHKLLILYLEAILFIALFKRSRFYLNYREERQREQERDRYLPCIGSLSQLLQCPELSWFDLVPTWNASPAGWRLSLLCHQARVTWLFCLIWNLHSNCCRVNRLSKLSSAFCSTAR